MYGEGNCTTFFVEYLLLTAGTTSCVVTQPLHGNATYTVNNGHTHIHIESYSYTDYIYWIQTARFNSMQNQTIKSTIGPA